MSRVMPRLAVASPREGLHATMTRSAVAGGALVAGAIALVWTCRSHYLFSWDSANFAFGVNRIDIAAHRPHPPGYLGYVLAARALAPLLATLGSSTINLAFIVWNAVALAVAALFTALLADDDDRVTQAPVVAVAILVSSPLVLFYTAVAEIYVSEMACVAAIAWTAREALHGRPNALYWCATAAAVTAVFKLSALVLMLPLVIYAFAAAPGQKRAGPLAVLGIALGSVGVMFTVIQPRFASILWEHFVTATSHTRVVGAAVDVSLGRAFNRNVRDTLTASGAMLGLNAIAFVGWVVADRKMRPGRNGRFVAVWTAPWLLEFFLIHVGKPGYFLPLLPAACLVLAGFYTRRRLSIAAALLSGSFAAGVGWFLFVPTPGPTPNDMRRYRDKPFLQRMASDLQGLTLPTRASIRASDSEVGSLLTAAAACRDNKWVIVAGSAHLDWRRTMYYLPAAMAVDLGDDGSYLFVGQNSTFVSAGLGVPISSDCGLLWIASVRPAIETIVSPEMVPGVGWRYPAGHGRVTPTSISWEPVSQLASAQEHPATERFGGNPE